MSLTRTDRRVLTFYSFKGGVGRTMALANVAFRLAHMHALRVIAVDWDLEAPGLHTFFGLEQERMANSRGVLDYFEEWAQAAKRRDPSPPDVTPWLVPIDQGPGAPKHGTLSLLVAGRLDSSYDRRLAALDWREFYAKGAGALAVETMRRQLVTQADVVLIDSRTGLTDEGGICTMQLPDGVVLMAAPNRQSLDGIERIARSVRTSGAKQRAGRVRPRTWLSICRVPSVEETYRADAWFDEQRGWFERGVREGLWLEEDHSWGLRTYEMPHRARWGFGEALLPMESSADTKDPLSMAYDTLTVALLGFCVGPLTGLPGQPSDDVESLRKQAAEAELRKDIPGLLVALSRWGRALDAANERENAIDVLRRGVAIAVGANLLVEQAALQTLLGASLLNAGRHAEAEEALGAALKIARGLKNRRMEAVILFYLVITANATGQHTKARELLASSMDEMQALGDVEHGELALVLSQMLHDIENTRDRTSALQERTHTMRAEIETRVRSLLALARQQGDADDEETAIEQLLELSADWYPLADVEALKARLAELKGGIHEQRAVPAISQAPSRGAPSRKRRR